MLSNSSQRQLRLEFLETRVNPTRLWFAANALPIPIGTDTTTAITLQVPDALVIGDIDLWVNVTHERMDEISLRLRSPSGTIIQLATMQEGVSKGYQNTIFDDQAANTLATFSDSEGQRYQPEQSLGIFQQLSAQGEWQLLVDDANLQANVGSVNSFKLGFTTLPDDHGESLSTATPLVSSNVSTWSESGSIEHAGDRDWFVWTAPANGSIQLSVNAANGSPIDTYLSLFNSQGVLIYANDDSGPGTNSVIDTFVNVGVNYIIEVRDYSTSMGSYTVTLATMDDDHGPTPATATPLTLSGSDTWSSAGSIQYSNDEDWFRWTAPADATFIQVTMDAAGGILRPSVSLLDSGGNDIPGVLAYSDSPKVSTVFTVLINPGSVYYIRAKSTDASLGSYKLKLILETIDDDHGSTPATATPLTLNGSGTWSSAGSIQYSSDEDWFRWTAPSDATAIQVTMDSAGGILRPSVTLLDSGGNNYDIVGATHNSELPAGSAVFTCPINPGAVYYISAKGYAALGSYTVNIVLITIEDDHGSSPATATPLTLNGSGTWSSAGSIQYSSDEDWFRWTAPADATFIQVTMDGAGAFLRPRVALLDSGGSYSDSLGGSAVFTASINPGAVYYILAQSYDGSLGPYTINVMLNTIDDDHGSTPATATPLTFSGSDTWSSAGIIQYTNDADWFRWIAPPDATVIQVTIDAAGGVLQPYVGIVDSRGNYISGATDAYSDSPGGSAVFRISIIPGGLYYIIPSSLNTESLGSYIITLANFKDDHGSTPATATPLTYNGSGRWSSNGSIEYSDDKDWFRWTAPADAKAIQVTMDASGGML
jgi:subtilisin-like proprotein convertase family protein